MALGACSKPGVSSFDDRATYKEVASQEVATDKIIPVAMWDQIIGEVTSATVTLRFLPVTVYLQEKSPGVLSDKNYKIKLGHGGGEIDLSRYVHSDAGTFILGFKLETEEPLDNLQVFYLSRTKKRSFDNADFGAGCSTFFDITKFFNSQLVKGGLEVNTYRKRHVTLLGGTFVFSLKSDGYHYISQVTFVDSQSEALFCAPLTVTE